MAGPSDKVESLKGIRTRRRCQLMMLIKITENSLAP
jgi:hypothetical protein